MTIPSDTLRVDLYAPIHKALRGFMSDTLARIGSLDVFDMAEMRDTLVQLERLLGQCESHLRHEEEFMHPALEARHPGASRRASEDHEDQAASIRALRVESRSLLEVPAPERSETALQLYRHLALFVAENFQHMQVEETTHNTVLWAHYSDDELTALHRRLLARIPPQESLQVARWMVPALPPEERTELLRSVQRSMPAEAFHGLLETVMPHLSHGAWVRLARELGVSPQTAPAFE
jgi:hemerythrin HHE cation binding domain-containing protein